MIGTANLSQVLLKLQFGFCDLSNTSVEFCVDHFSLLNDILLCLL